MSPIERTAGGGGGGGSTQLDYVTQSTDLNVTANTAATAQTFIAGNSVTYGGATRIKVEFWSVAVFSTVGACIIELFRDTTDLGRVSQSALSAPAGPFYGAFFDTPTAGAHTYTIAAWRSNNTSTASVTGTTGGVFLPAWYRITTA
jgi:hypothetical protein